MAAPSFTVPTLVFGVSCVLLGLTVWSMVPGRRHLRSVRRWVLGVVLLGCGAVFTAYGGFGLSNAATNGIASVMDLISFTLRIQALRMHIGIEPGWKRLAALVVFQVLACAACWQLGGERAVLSYTHFALAAWAAAFAWNAAVVGLRLDSRSAALVAGSEGLLAVALVVRGLSMVLVGAPGATWDYWLLLAAAVIGGIYGNLGYLGLVLDTTRRDEARAREARVVESAGRAAAESTAADLRSLLAQRDRLAAERQRMVEVLAHEIRQPLNNAGSALQATASVLRGMEGEGATQATARLQRAQAVLGSVNSVLDNTLAVASLLADDQPLTLQEVELDLLVEVVLGDLGEAQRARVEVRRLADLRSAALETGLMRLALRNLLLNALRHGGAGAQVVLQVAERESPPALLLCVADDGPGMAEAQMHDAVRAIDDPARQPGRGLGLYIAHTVARRHGGELTLQPHGERGLRACLAVPLPG